MKTFITLALTLGLLFHTGTAAFCVATPDKINMTRKFAVFMALTKNGDLMIESRNSAIAEADAAGSRGIYNPLLVARINGGAYTYTFQPGTTTTGSGSLALTQTLPTGGSVTAYTDTSFYKDPASTGAASEWTSNAGIVVSQPLLRNVGKEKTEAGITLANNSLTENRHRYRFAAIDTVYATVTAYNSLFTARQLLESRNRSLTATQALLDDLRKKRRSGPTAQEKVEIANAEYSLAQKRKEIVDADRRVRDLEANLRYLIGMEEKIPIIPIEAPSRDEPADSEAQAIGKALELRSDLKQLRQALESSQLQERVARNLALPDLSLSASAAFDGKGDSPGSSYQQLGDGKSTSWATGLQFSLPLGNTGATNEYRRNRIRSEQLRMQIRTLSQKIRNDVEADERALISARLQLQTTQQSLEYSEVRHKEYLKNNRAGTATVQDVINAENDFSAARIAHFEALEAFANSVEKLRRDTGELLEHHDLKLAVSGTP